MTELFYYLMKSSIILSILYLLYLVLLSRHTFHRLNRFTLLGIMAFAMICPHIEMPEQTYPLPLAFNEEFASTELYMEPITQLDKPQKKYTLSTLLMSIYLLGSIFMFIRFSRQLFLIISLRLSAIKDNWEQIQVLRTDFPGAPFSFFHWIFVPRNANESTILLAHEKAHARQWHSCDMLILEIALVFLWFNPFVWMLKRSLKRVHEYLADEQVIQSGISLKAYFRLLIQPYTRQTETLLSHNLFGSTLKHRIKMMTKSRSTFSGKLLYLLLLPVLALMLQAFAKVPISSSPEIALPIDIVVPPVQSHRPDITPIASGYGFISGFGMRMHPVLKEKRMHLGVDFAAPEGTPIRATADGKIIVLDKGKPNEGYGMRIEIQHGEVYKTLYAHMSGFNVSLNQEVKKGEIIGYVGSTGASKANHLHYEVLKNGKRVDPANYY